ncbi:MAG: hypothetical protein JWN20_777 [Jatrophihabitantaceae bacterium]|nr:hypothetical protein [Jatrophihabitantaceae bacterium]
MADSVGVLIDGQPAGRSGADPGAGRPGRAVSPLLRRRLLLGLAGLGVAVLALSTVVGQVRDHAIPGDGRTAFIVSVDLCPPDRACAISDQPSAVMWDAAYHAFPEYTQVSTTVVFDAGTGVSYSESIKLTYGAIVIRLTVTRDPGSVPRAMSVDVTAASTDGVVVIGVPVDGGADRKTTAALSGPEDALLPVDAALVWAATVDLFGDAPR